MNVYEVVFAGTGGRLPDDSDTAYLVRAPDFRSALDGVRLNRGLSVPRLATTVFEIGADLTRSQEDFPRIIRGPYFARTYNYGWKSWDMKIERAKYAEDWEESR
jgi:hypothetical protein